MTDSEELSMIREGVARMRRKKAQAAERGGEAYLPPQRLILDEAMPRFVRFVRNWIMWVREQRTGHRAFEAIERCGPEIAAWITAHEVLDQLSRTRNARFVANSIAQRIEEEMKARALNETHPFRKKGFIKRGTKTCTSTRALRYRRWFGPLTGEWSRWPSELNYSIGHVLLELMRRSTKIFELRNTIVRGKQIIRISPTDETTAWIEAAHERLEETRPVLRPISDLPLDWPETLDGGGFHLPELRYPLVRESRRIVRTAPIVARAANFLQRSALRVNARVLAVADRMWTQGIEGPSMPRAEKIPLPPKVIPNFDNGEEQQTWRIETALTYAANDERALRRARTVRSLQLAKDLATLSRFYYPQKVDRRGRVYPIFSPLSWIGKELERGLLEFATGVECGATGAGFIARQLASSWGLSRASYEERERWVAANGQEILAAAADPIAERHWWGAAKEPWQFLAACFAWSDFVRGTGNAHEHLPCKIDGSCNALQIMSLLARDQDLAVSVNVLASEGPRDLYSEIANEMARKITESQEERGRAWTMLLGDTVPRDLVKPLIVSATYGGCVPNMTELVVGWYQAQPKRAWKDQHFPICTWFAVTLYHLLKERVGLGFETLSWLRSISKPLSANGIDLRWTSPSGFLVVQDERKPETKRITTATGAVVRGTDFQQDTEILDRDAQARAFGPNFVQSLDAAVLHLEAVKLDDHGVPACLTTHDGYAVHAAHMGTLHGTLRETYAEVFHVDQLSRVRDELAAHSCLALTVDPPRGTLDPSSVLDAPYLFS